MKRSEFKELETLSGIYDFICEENASDIVDMVNEEELADRLEREIEELLRYGDWTDVKDLLEKIDEGYDYYEYSSFLDGYLNLTELDVYELKDRILDNYTGFEPEDDPKAIIEEAGGLDMAISLGLIDLDDYDEDEFDSEERYELEDVDGTFDLW